MNANIVKIVENLDPWDKADLIQALAANMRVIEKTAPNDDLVAAAEHLDMAHQRYVSGALN
jgi:hypothetical protein